jgi:hypothetical protein
MILTKGIISAAARLNATEAALVLGRGARAVIASLERESNTTLRSVLAAEMALLAEHMSSADANLFCDQAISVLLLASTSTQIPCP